jgi:anti-sigma-K factor RskA
VQDRQTQVAQTTLEEQLRSAPDAVTTTTTELTSGGQVTFVASKQLNRALFVGTGLPDPGQNRYQLWTGSGSLTVENGITRIARDRQIAESDPRIKVFFTGNVAGADFLAVNLEPAGSVPAAPTNSVLAAGRTTT